MTNAKEFDKPQYFVNRELSWLEFNARVLEQAKLDRTPLFERLKFLSIFSSNLDEFFMIRVANLKELEATDLVYHSPDGMTPVEQLRAIAKRSDELVAEQYRLLNDDVLPAMSDLGVELLKWDQLTSGEQAELADYFNRQVFPVLTPLTVDPSHPFPYLANLSLNLLVTLAAIDGNAPGDNVAVVEVPEVLDRLIPVGGDEATRFIPLEDLIEANIGTLFPGLTVTGAWAFRVTRNSDISLEEQEVENLLKDIERELRTRTFRPVVRVEVSAGMPDEIVRWLLDGCQATRRELFVLDGILNVPALMRLYGAEGFDEYRDPPFNPRLSPRMDRGASIFKIVRDGDVLIHHPYESFSTVAELISHASWDPKVLAIKLTLYRTSGDSVIIQALKEAAQNGKQVTAVVELKARFDEQNNIVWARELERAGAHVVYGMVGLKTHSKTALVVRNERGHIRRYVHLGTGNYNSSTAKLYTDLALLTCDPELGEDVSLLFNVLTSYAQDTIQAIRKGRAPAPDFKKLLVAPFSLRERFIELIEQEIELHSEESPGFIRAKCNSLSDPQIIRYLYKASAAGVRVDLNIRGICCLRTGIPGVSDNISVVSVIDRFLEHSRIYHFGHGGEDIVLVGSADWMTRNLNRRIEAVFPVEDEALKSRLIHQVLGSNLNDNVSGWDLNADDTWTRRTPAPGEEALRSQSFMIAQARDGGVKLPNYDVALRQPRIPRRD